MALVAAQDAGPQLPLPPAWHAAGMRGFLLHITAASYNARTRTLALVARQSDAAQAGPLGHLLGDVPMLPLGEALLLRCCWLLLLC